MYHDPDDTPDPIGVQSALEMSRRARFAAKDFETLMMLVAERAKRRGVPPDPVELARLVRAHADTLSDIVTELHAAGRRIERGGPG